MLRRTLDFSRNWTLMPLDPLA